jgi:hypothetical protein
MTAFVLGYLVSMRYVLVGYLRRCCSAAARIALHDPAELILLNIAQRSKAGS